MHLRTEVVVLRGAIEESRHRVECAAVGPAGQVRAASGHAARVTSFRSAAKPFQLLPFVERGHADALGASDAELAIMAASHSGSREHLALVQGLLDRAGIPAARLACGYHEPQDPAALEEVRREPERRGPIYNNCSGKHAAMLAFARAEGWPLEGYERADHPLQQLMLGTVAECCGLAPESVLLGVDGCGVPVFGLPLQAMALGYARLAAAMARPADQRARCLQRIGRAMTSHPVVVEGHGRLATDLMLATSGRVLAKSGAEGLLLVADPSRGLGIAVKCEDGAMRAVGPAVVELLLQLEVVRPDELPALAAQRRPPVHDAAGHEVGWLEARVAVGVAGGAGA
jgi:L-asparaginase II